jgi:dihydroorotate dehydrogenase (NAD+) catalytic subunit
LGLMGMADMTVHIGSLTLRSPVLLASGTAGFGTEFAELLDFGVIGGVCTKGISLKPRAGNPAPRIWETPSGVINAIGLENPGIDGFLANKVPAFPAPPLALIPNIFGVRVEDYAELARRLDDVARVDAIEVNISCPNVKEGGVPFGNDPRGAAAVTRSVRKATRKPIIVKLSPNAGDVAAVGKAVEDEGADAVSAINTIVAMSIDVRTRKARIASVTGGLSGPAIRPVAVRMVFECRRKLKIPIVGIGGVMTAEDAIEFLLAGACCVQVGTANFVDPSCAAKITRGIADYLDEHGLGSVTDLVGKLELPGGAFGKE